MSASTVSIINQPYVAAQCGKYSGVCIVFGRKSNTSHVSHVYTAYKIGMKLKTSCILNPFHFNFRLYCTIAFYLSLVASPLIFECLCHVPESSTVSSP